LSCRVLMELVDNRINDNTLANHLHLSWIGAAASLIPPLPLTLTHPGHSVPAIGLLDMEATVNVLPHRTGRELGEVCVKPRARPYASAKTWRTLIPLRSWSRQWSAA
jgi:hypothetical protein